VPTLNFTVDSALLEELGQRLVGKPYIALAELVKNGYDADATEVEIDLDPKADCITVNDNGHGMDFDEFKGFWMRIGSTHKQLQRISRHFERPMTGSKGVGRLAAQYLAEELFLSTISENDLSRELKAHVKWKEAAEAGDLTQAAVEYSIGVPKKQKQGTSIVLKGLKEDWDPNLIKGLAREIWWLQPPFRFPADYKKSFNIKFSSPEKDYIDTFDQQIHAILNIWHARLVGSNRNGKVTLSLEFAGEEPITVKYPIEDCSLKGGDFEIRIYHLWRRQPHGITVGEARTYLNEYGGVHVYDGGFHLPYYGDPKNDWLKVEFAHSHRLSISELLPEEMRVARGMSYLPTLSRMLGVVNVSTAEELDLKILITRDRLQDSKAFRNLAYLVRYALDFYAYEEAKRAFGREDLEREIEQPKIQRMEDVLVKYRAVIPEKSYEDLHDDLKKAMEDIETEAESTAKKIGLMGSLATAGISSLAYQHELKQQFNVIRNIVREIEEIKIKDEKLRNTLNELKETLSSWVNRAEMTNALFAYFADSENLELRKRFQARKVVQEITEQVGFLSRGIPIHMNRLDDSCILPKASLAEWSSIFQNVFINAFNAMLDSKKRMIDVSSRKDGRIREILVQDTGCGVDLDDSEILFKPFVRRMKISPERRALGYGGTGLGLTIVRLISRNIGCDVSFVEPEKEFSTAFSIRWRETE